MVAYETLIAREWKRRVELLRTKTARATVVAVTADGFVTFTDAMGATRKGVWLAQQPAIGDVVTYLDEGTGFPIVLGTSGSRAWTQVSAFVNSWANYIGGWDTAAYRKVGDIVYLRGLVKDGTIPATIFTLPAGFRPPGNLVFAVDSATNAHGRCDVHSTGAVIAQGGANGYFTLSGISFSTV